MEAWTHSDNGDYVMEQKEVEIKKKSMSFKYDLLPADFRDALAVFDEDGSGDLNAAEIRKAAKTYKDFSNSNGVYALDSFPNDLQSTHSLAPLPPIPSYPNQSHMSLAIAANLHWIWP